MAAFTKERFAGCGKEREASLNFGGPRVVTPELTMVPVSGRRPEAIGEENGGVTTREGRDLEKRPLMKRFFSN